MGCFSETHTGKTKMYFKLDICNYATKCDCNGTRTHNHLAGKRTLNRLAKLVKNMT